MTGDHPVEGDPDLADRLKAAAGIICGVLVAGFLGRFVMRVFAATSGDGAQGLLTDAEEVVGEMTLSGTIGFIVFVGLGAGAVAAIVLLVAQWPAFHLSTRTRRAPTLSRRRFFVR